MKERGLKTRVDVTYPYDKIDEQSGQLIESFQQPPVYDVKFYYQRSKRGSPIFKIFAQRMDQQNEQYEIEIQG